LRYKLIVREAAAARLARIPPYLFKELDELKVRAGSALIDLGEGSPDQPAASAVNAVMTKALSRTENHRYPSYSGKPETRAAAADWYFRRFGVELDPESEVVMLLGSKEGVAHLIWGTCGPGDVAGVSDPGYPVYQNQVKLAGATPVSVPLQEQHGFLPDLSWLRSIASRLKLLCLNYPSNPTGAVASLDFYQEAVTMARRFGFFIVNDNVYSELYFSKNGPPSILQVHGAKDCCVEFHSLSKTFSMAGWRIGMAVGNRALLAAMLKIKQNTDSGPFGAVQDAAAWVLRRGASLARQNREMYRRRRDVFCDELKRSGWAVPKPEATFYVWARVPEHLAAAPAGESASVTFTRKLLVNCQVMTAPGAGFGQYGEGYVRFALVADEKKLGLAAKRIGAWLAGR
jgi:LL-diaminopimelate aminotransferase